MLYEELTHMLIEAEHPTICYLHTWGSAEPVMYIQAQPEDLEPEKLV